MNDEETQEDIGKTAFMDIMITTIQIFSTILESPTLDKKVKDKIISEHGEIPEEITTNIVELMANIDEIPSSIKHLIVSLKDDLKEMLAMISISMFLSKYGHHFPYFNITKEDIDKTYNIKIKPIVDYFNSVVGNYNYHDTSQEVLNDKSSKYYNTCLFVWTHEPMLFMHDVFDKNPLPEEYKYHLDTNIDELYSKVSLYNAKVTKDDIKHHVNYIINSNDTSDNKYFEEDIEKIGYNNIINHIYSFFTNTDKDNEQFNIIFSKSREYLIEILLNGIVRTQHYKNDESFDFSFKLMTNEHKDLIQPLLMFFNNDNISNSEEILKKVWKNIYDISLYFSVGLLNDYELFNECVGKIMITHIT